MAPSKLRKAIGAVKDQTSIGLAKVGSSTSLSDLDVAIVKATRHEEYPPDERYIREVLSLTTYSRTFVSACVRTISRRLSKTKNWVVALKTLMLIQRLLSEGDDAYEQEIFFATRRGTRLLNMSDFRDTSARSNSWDYSAFVRTYGLYLDEQLEFRMQARRGSHGRYASRVESEEEGAGGGSLVVRGTPLRDMKTAGIFSRINHLIQLLERFLACKPAGAEMVKVHEIFSRVSKQYDELDSFYTWSKAVGLARASEYPEVEKISQQRLDMMDDYIHEKSAMEQNRQATSPEPKPEPLEEAEPEQDMNSIKVLPPPPEFVEEKVNEEEQKEEVEEPKEEKAKAQEGDLLNLGDGAPTTQEHGDKLALALFDGSPATDGPDSKMTPWEAFKESSSGDWETALVLSVSHLSNQKVSLPGGFDTLILDGMYQQGAMAQAVASSGLIATGSSSSVALGSAGRPAMLALPAPPSAEGGATTSSENSDPFAATTSSENSDPFAASLAIPPPPYVQMSEMEKKQKFLIQEQAMWQQYTRDGMQGQVGLFKANQNSNPYNTGGYGTW